MSQQKEIIEINVNIDRLKGRRGILCGLLCAAVFGTLLCLGLFAGKTNEINSDGSTVGVDVCSLFVKHVFYVPDTEPHIRLRSSSPSICHYVIGGSVIVFLILLVLLTETLIAVFIAFAFTE